MTRNAAEAEEWALVLAASGIPHRLELTADAWTLVVPDVEASRASAALDAYAAETSDALDVSTPGRPSSRASWILALGVGASLLVFFAVTGPPSSEESRWFARGAAAARDIVGGEWWRAVTALTLHLDAVHVAGNAAMITVLLPAVMQRLGFGCGLALVLLAGAGANLFAAMVHDAHHVAVGASGAVFGAIAILAALRLVPGATAPRTSTRPWVVVVASVLFLTMLGASRGSDILGHVLGLVSGGALGLVVGASVRRPFGVTVQWALVALAVLVVVGCWWLALR